VLPDDPTLEELWDTFTWFTSIPSKPPGATVFRQPYGKPNAEWEQLGTTPLYDIHIPLGLSLLRIELDGHLPLLRIIGGETNMSRVLTFQEEPVTGFPQIHPGAYDFGSADSLPAGMVRVPGEGIVLDGEQVALRDFYIDRYEVTNRQFKEFVDAGGYQRRDLWPDEFVLDGAEISWDQAIAEFTDRTGRPGPSTWEAGIYPDGKDDHPVAGVSWYEAAAYARFVRRELPTVYHWRRAFAGGMLSWILPESNLNSEGTVSVGQSEGIGWTGTYDMAGNVSEWCLNSSGDQRVLLGGSWDDPPYMVLNTIFDPGSMPAFTRSSTNGFRLAVSHDERSAAQILREPVPDPEDVVIADAVSDEVFEAYRNLFDYDPAEWQAKSVEWMTARYWTRERISLNSGGDGERLDLYLYLPNTNASHYQTIIFWPSDTALYVDSVEQLRGQLDFALKNGRAVALPILDGTFERRNPTYPDWASIDGRDLIIRQVKEMRRTIDYLETRQDIDSEALAYYGFSWGGRMGAIVLAVEPRLKVGVLNQAGLQHLKIPETSVLNYLGRVKVPVLQFNGIYDTDFRFETQAVPFFKLIGSADKKHVHGATGHFVQKAKMIGETLDWLDKYLGPVPR
jgi:predicted esterase